MSTELDDKLREILSNSVTVVGPNTRTATISGAIEGYAEQIKQAFAAAGYSTFRDRDGLRFMTGQMFYDRFWKHYETETPKVIDATIIREQVDVIIKKAVGLK